jgi:hypothetical protein
MNDTEARRIEDQADIDALRHAAHVLRRRSRKRTSLIRDRIRRILTDLAQTIEDELEDTQ